MAIVATRPAGYNPRTDDHIAKLSWHLMDQHLTDVCRYRLMDSVADAVRQIQQTADSNLDPEDRAGFWQALGACVFELGSEPAAVRTVKRPILDPPTDGDDVCGADIPYLVSA